MDFKLSQATPILRRTPRVIRALLAGLPEPWITATEGPDSWSPFDIVGHLIHGERTDWIPRVEWIIAHGESRPFPPFDRVAMLEASRGKTLNELLDTFAKLRAESIAHLRSLKLKKKDLKLRGTHPEFGQVTMSQHLATWVAHDLGHISQIVRVMAQQYERAVGPWIKYLPLLTAS
jgi:hypothetical protein